MPLHWLGALLNINSAKHPLDEYQPKVALPQTAQDWIVNIIWLKEWLTSVFTNVLKLDPDITQRSRPAADLGEPYRIYRTRSDLEEARRLAFTTLDELATVLQEQEYGSHGLLSPHIEMVWPFVQAYFHETNGLQCHHAQLVLDRMRGWQMEARADMTEILSIDERGRRLLQAFDWKPVDCIQ